MTDGVWIWLRAVATDKEGFRGGLGYLLRTAPGSLRARSRPGSERLYRQLQQPGSGGPPGRQRGNGAASRAYTGSGPEGASTSARLPQTAPAGSQPLAAGSPPRRPPSPPRSHHTGNQQTRQPSAGSRRPGRAAPRAKTPAPTQIANNRGVAVTLGALGWAWPPGGGCKPLQSLAKGWLSNPSVCKVPVCAQQPSNDRQPLLRGRDTLLLSGYCRPWLIHLEQWIGLLSGPRMKSFLEKRGLHYYITATFCFPKMNPSGYCKRHGIEFMYSRGC